jgi:hypothetical protein
MWVEILKIVAPSALTAIIVGYIFNKKLEKHKMFLKINEQFLSSLINGLHLLMNDYKAVILQVNEIRKHIEKDNYHNEPIDKLETLKQEYENTLRGHRIYLAALIPYSRTGASFHSHDDINLVGVNLLLNQLREMQKIANPVMLRNYRDEALEFIDYINLSYESACYRANQIIAHIQNGKNPFSIRWERSTLPEWEAIASVMHRKNLSIDLQKDTGGYSRHLIR